jgi:hypothetical protein
MSNDNLKGSNFNIGQEVRAVDLNEAQRFELARVCDQFLEKLVPGPFTTSVAGIDLSPYPGLNGDNAPYSGFQFSWAFALTSGGAYPRKGTANTKIQVAPGTLFQKIGARTGDEPTFVPYTFTGTEEVTIANGDATNPRVDVVQMKLEWENGDNVARVFQTAPITASIDTDPLATLADTEWEAKVSGSSGNQIKLKYEKRLSGVGVTIVEAGWLVTVQYEDGVSTNLAAETAMTATGTLLKVKVAGTPGNILTDPGNSFGPTNLAGGVDSVLVSQNFDMKRRVKCTLSVKQGTPAASPAYPDVDAGYVAIAGVVVPATWTGASAPVSEDTAGAASLVIHDQRMPIGTPKRYTCLAMHAIYDSSLWTFTTDRTNIRANAGKNAQFPFPTASGGYGGGIGRVVGVEYVGSQADGSPPLTHLASRRFDDAGAVTIKTLNHVDNTGNVGGVAWVNHRPLDIIESQHTPAAGPTIQSSASGELGVPVWANGRRGIAPPPDTASVVNLGHEDLVWSHPTTTSTITALYRATIFVAEGL